MDETKVRGKALEEGSVIARKYTVREVLGIGGFGITYRAVSADGQAVAVKEYFRSSLCSRRGSRMEYSEPVSAQVLAGMKAFVNEGNRLKSIAGKHRNIVDVKELVYDNDTVYIVMELVEGKDLAAFVGSRADASPIGAPKAVEMLMPVIDAVAMLHAARITHLDIKPGNILLSGTGQDMRPVLIDFGLSKHYDESGVATTVSTMAGCTPGYAPAEQYAEDVSTFSPQSDVYSLGATLFFLLTGSTPPMASTAGSAVIRRRLADAGTDSRVAEVVSKAMSMSRDDRQPDAGALKRELSEALAHDADAHADSRPWLGRGIRRRLLAIVCVFALMSVALAGAFMWLGVDPGHPDDIEPVKQADAADTAAVGYGIYGDDRYGGIEAPGAMINIDSIPVEANVGDAFIVEIGVKTKSGLRDVDSMARLMQPALRCSRFADVSVAGRRSEGDSLTVFSYRFVAEAPGTEMVPEMQVEIDGHRISLPSHMFAIH